MLKSDFGSLRDLVRQRLTRRGLLRASGAGVASAVIVGLGSESAASASVAPTAASSQTAALRLSDLQALDPHATTGVVLASPRAQAEEVAVKIYPIDRAKMLAGSWFDLRVEALNVELATASISIDVSGPNGPEKLLQAEPERSSPTADILAVTYPKLHYEAPGATLSPPG